MLKTETRSRLHNVVITCVIIIWVMRALVSFTAIVGYSIWYSQLDPKESIPEAFKVLYIFITRTILIIADLFVVITLAYLFYCQGIQAMIKKEY